MDGASSDLADQVVSLLDTAPEPAVVVDGRGVVRFANGRVRELLGHEPQALVGTDVRQVLPDWDGVVGRRGAPQPRHPEVAAWHRSGRTLPVELTVSSLDRGTDGLVSVFLRDVSERLEQARQADRMRDELIANISHELRTPLTSVIGYLEILRELGDDELGARARAIVEIIERNAHRELRLVNDLLTVSFVDDHVSRMVVEDVDLVAVAAQVVDEQRPLVHGAGLGITLHGDGPAVVRGDADQLVRVVENLVTNSIKFSPPGGEIRVGVAAESSTQVRLEVADTGIGVSEAEGARLFERMYRAPGAIDRQTVGAGLGLPIVKAIVDAHGGTITLHSRPGLGTTIVVQLPRASG